MHVTLISLHAARCGLLWPACPQVSATIHLANRNWAALVDDFIDLEFLPTDANR
jgi:hypothetical protein